ncbi:MAG: hypothetical protein JNK49_13115 [Planctomycetes bacterium]|nr:hypothetical protein [Planctomycetota bacterium]
MRTLGGGRGDDLDDLAGAVMARLCRVFLADALSGPAARWAYAKKVAWHEVLDSRRRERRALVQAAGDLADLEEAERLSGGGRVQGDEVESAEIEARLPLALAAIGLDQDGAGMFLVMDWGGGTLADAQRQLGLGGVAAASVRRGMLRILSDPEVRERLFRMVAGDLPLGVSPQPPTPDLVESVGADPS